jgi:hypothetical protein
MRPVRAGAPVRFPLVDAVDRARFVGNCLQDPAVPAPLKAGSVAYLSRYEVFRPVAQMLRHPDNAVRIGGRYYLDQIRVVLEEHLAAGDDIAVQDFASWEPRQPQAAQRMLVSMFEAAFPDEALSPDPATLDVNPDHLAEHLRLLCAMATNCFKQNKAMSSDSARRFGELNELEHPRIKTLIDYLTMEFETFREQALEKLQAMLAAYDRLHEEEIANYFKRASVGDPRAEAVTALERLQNWVLSKPGDLLATVFLLNSPAVTLLPDAVVADLREYISKTSGAVDTHIETLKAAAKDILCSWGAAQLVAEASSGGRIWPMDSRRPIGPGPQQVRRDSELEQRLTASIARAGKRLMESLAPAQDSPLLTWALWLRDRTEHSDSAQLRKPYEGDFIAARQIAPLRTIVDQLNQDDLQERWAGRLALDAIIERLQQGRATLRARRRAVHAAEPDSDLALLASSLRDDVQPASPGGEIKRLHNGEYRHYVELFPVLVPILRFLHSRFSFIRARGLRRLNELLARHDRAHGTVPVPARKIGRALAALDAGKGPSSSPKRLNGNKSAPPGEGSVIIAQEDVPLYFPSVVDRRRRSGA